MLAWLLVQQSTLTEPSLWEQFGPFSIVFVLMAAAIVWLLRDNSAKAERERLLYDRIIEQGEHLATVLERNTEVITRFLEQTR